MVFNKRHYKESLCNFCNIINVFLINKIRIAENEGSQNFDFHHYFINYK